MAFGVRRGEGLSSGVPFRLTSENVDFVSFDLFGTLLLFPLPGPAPLWEMVGQSIGMPDFPRLRQAAQAEAARRAKGLGRHTLTHDDIFDCLDLPAAQREFAKRTELLYESALWQPHPQLRAIYAQRAQVGQAVLVGETVHGRSFVASLLSRLGLPDAPLVLSSEVDAPLSSGRLFAIAADALHASPERILHLGREGSEALKQAAASGFRTQAVEGDVPPPMAGEGAASLSYGLRRLGPDRRQEPERSLGFQVLGPLYCGFLRWMEWHARINAIDAIVALPEMGAVMAQLAPTLGGSALPVRALLGTSGLPLILAGVSDRTFDERMSLLIREADGACLSDLLDRLGVPVPSEQVMAGLGLGDDVVIGVEQHALLRRFLVAYRWPILATARRHRREMFQALLAQGVTPGARIALVGLDWDGSVQEAFEQAMDGVLDMEVYGYSLCLLDTPETRRRQSRMHIKAMFGRESVGEPTLDLLSRRKPEVEALLHAAAGSAKGAVPTQVAKAAKEQSAALFDGAEAFVRLFNGFVAATGYEAEPLEIAAPFLDGLADLRTPAVAEHDTLGPHDPLGPKDGRLAPASGS